MEKIMNFWRNALPLQKALSVLTILAFVFMPFAQTTWVYAHTGGGDHTFSASVSPSSIDLGGTESFTFSITNTGGVAETPASWEMKSFSVLIPADFSLNISSLAVSESGWDVQLDVPSNEIRVSVSGGSSAQVDPGESISVTGEITSTGSSGGNTTWTARAFKNNSFTPGEGAEFHGDGSGDIIIIVDDPEPTTGTLVVVKNVTNNNGGTATSSDFILNVLDNTQTEVESDNGSAEGVSYTLEAGDYTVTEDSFVGYTPDFTDCGGNGTVSVVAGATTTCTVVNDDNESVVATTGILEVIKQVVNNNGGTATSSDFTIEVSGTTTTSFEGSLEGEILELEVGNYTVSETGTTIGYTQDFSACGDGTVTVNENATTTCTIVNNDIDPGVSPAATSTLTLVKTVENNDGGTNVATDWTLSATGATTTISGRTGSSTVTDAEVEAGVYTLSESGPSGYTPSGWQCESVGGSDFSLTGDQLTIEADADVTCTITNDDIPEQPTGDDDDDDDEEVIEFRNPGGGGGGSSDDDDDDDGEVLGDTIEFEPQVLPATVGLPATGAGGGANNTWLPVSLVLMIGALLGIKREVAVETSK